MRPRKGLRVKHCENVARFSTGAGGLNRLVEVVPDGFYIQTWRADGWVAIMGLLFARERDAVRGAQSLTLAGLDTYPKLSRADPILVKQIACENLQW